MPTEVIIRVSACGVSQLDKRIVCGDLSDIKPSTGKLGFEVSGTIEKIGHSVEGYAVGDEVVAAIPADVGGGFAELVAVSIYSIGMKILFIYLLSPLSSTEKCGLTFKTWPFCENFKLAFVDQPRGQAQ